MGAVDASSPYSAAAADHGQVEGCAPCGTDDVAAIFASWLAERYPGARWVVERREAAQSDRVTPGPGEILRQVGREQDAGAVA